MFYIITNHATQRRPHYEKISRELLTEKIKILDSKFNFEKLDDGKYKMYYKNFCAIISKEKNKLILITIRGIDRVDTHLNKIKMCLANRAFNNGGSIVRRTNYKGKLVKCGYIIDIYGTDRKFLKLHRNLHKKLKIRKVSNEGLEFTNLSEIEDLIYLKNGEYFLVDAERVNPVY